MTSLCEYCGDREGETLDRWECWACPACLANGEAVWRDSLGGALELLHERVAALGGPAGWWFRRKLERFEREYRGRAKAALERALGRRLP